jgi:2'-5' RNA ligase
MEKYAIVYFPKINTDKINAFRKKHDPHWNIIPPHITLVSPFSGISEDKLLKHIAIVTKDMTPFQVHLYGLMKTDDYLLFLLVKEGKEEIIKIHNLFYSGILTSLEQKYTFNPHITLGKFDRKDAQKAYEEAKEIHVDIQTTFYSISLIKGDGMSPAKIVKNFILQMHHVVTKHLSDQ